MEWQKICLLFILITCTLRENTDGNPGFYLLNSSKNGFQSLFKICTVKEKTVQILGIDLPSITIPVKPGRNLSIILEIAAMNNRQKRMGYNTAEEFNKRMNRLLAGGETEE